MRTGPSSGTLSNSCMSYAGIDALHTLITEEEKGRQKNVKENKSSEVDDCGSCSRSINSSSYSSTSSLVIFHKSVFC